MKAKDLKKKSLEELVAEEKALKSQLFKLRFQHATNQLENPIQLRDVKKDIARIKTLIKQIELAASQEGK